MKKTRIAALLLAALTLVPSVTTSCSGDETKPADTQTVTEVLVSQGDTVKKGDLLMTFDTTLSDLELERKRLGVEKLKLQLEDAKERLREIRGGEEEDAKKY